MKEGEVGVVVIVGYDFRLVRRGSPGTDALLMCHEYFPNKKLYATKRMVHIIEEGPKEHLFGLERPSLDSSIAPAVVPQEEGVDRFKDKEDEDTPLSILPSGSCGITVTEADIAMIRYEGISVTGDNYPAPDNIIQYDDVLPTH